MGKIKKISIPKSKKKRSKKQDKVHTDKKASKRNALMGNLKVKTKILLLALILISILIAVSSYNISGLNKINQSVQDLDAMVVPLVNEISGVALNQLGQTAVYQEIVIAQLQNDKNSVIRLETEFVSMKLFVEENLKNAIKFTEVGMTSNDPVVKEKMTTFNADLNEINDDYLAFYYEVNEAIKLIRAEKIDKYKKSATRIDNMQSLLTQQLNSFNESVLMFSKEVSTELDQSSRSIRQTTLTMTFIGVLVSLIPIMIIPNTITKPLRVIESHLKCVATGDLTVEIDKHYLKRKDEIGVISVAIDNVIQSVNRLVKQLQTSSVTIVESSENLSNIASDTTHSTNEIADAISDIAHGSSDQARQTEDGVQKINTLSTNIDQVESVTLEMSNVSESTKTLNNKGMACLSQLNDKTAESQNAFSNIETSVLTVDDSMGKIEEITATIQSLSDQTNLLALNAAIEAARAGDAGKGFAVVADEVRKLAVQSSRSADDINGLINEIKETSQSAVKALNGSKHTMDEQNKVVSDTNAIFEEIMTSINTLIDMIANVTSSIDYMSSMKDGIVETIHTISASAEEASASTEEISASTEEQLATMEEVSSFSETLNNLANELQVNISKFKV